MKTLLVIHSSGRVTRSITRRLAERFAQTWQARDPHHAVIYRDLTQSPASVVDEAWIAAAFCAPEKRTEAMREPLRLSETLIEELVAADALVIGAPVYNFGMPAQLKAYFDQVVRVGRTFAFEPGTPELYRALLVPKPVVVITSAGDGALLPGGALSHLNHLEPHLRTVLDFIGLRDVRFVRVGYDEFGDDRLRRSIAAAEAAIDGLAAGMAGADTGEEAGRPLRTQAEAIPI